MKKIAQGIWQIGVLLLFSVGMNALMGWLHWPIPGSIVGMLLLFILLQTRVIRLSWIEIGASWLLAELLLFFIPSAVGVMDYLPLLEHDGMSILFIVLLGTFIVMAVTGLVATFISKRKGSKAS
ncbi:CidA/LrgA family protein [Paenibacillus massiliensis]|uniref:CidA/LrgA family protein n=1 Tax=Paenibacillus massiliensis TaxID=225917 RepID=UPI0003F60DAB|nr:CidA/LrgA family holin-like protein [Paenibacillus massiliensis]